MLAPISERENERCGDVAIDLSLGVSHVREQRAHGIRQSDKVGQAVIGSNGPCRAPEIGHEHLFVGIGGLKGDGLDITRHASLEGRFDGPGDDNGTGGVLRP
ncbi:MAG: hypothetical protein J7498_01850 [Sphingobium sp.]|nr:hypothetical protein [Sphingobium sp.]